MALSRHATAGDCIEFVRHGTYAHSDAAIDWILSDGKEHIHRTLLEGIRIDHKGILHATRPFVVHPHLQPEVDYFLWRLVLLAKPGMALAPSLDPDRIFRIEIPAHTRTLYDPNSYDLQLETFRLPEELTGLPNLRQLFIRHRWFNHLPETVCRLQHLEVLDCSMIFHLEYLPEALYGLKNLRVLLLRHTRVKHISRRIGELKELRMLSLHSTCLRELPEEIFGLQKLTFLEVGSTPIDRFRCPPDALPRLRHLDVSSLYNLHDKDRISLPRGVTSLDFSLNTISDIPYSMTRLWRLGRLKLNYNDLQCIPDRIGSLGRLRRLDFWCNRPTYVSPRLASLKQLRTLIHFPAHDLPTGYIPEIHGEGLEGMKHYMAVNHGIYGMDMHGEEREDRLSPYFYFHRWRIQNFEPGKVDALRSRFRYQLFKSSPRMRAYFGSDATRQSVLAGIEAARREGLPHFETALLFPYRIRRGVLYRMPEIWHPFEFDDGILHAVVLELAGRMDASELRSRFGEESIRRIYDKLDAAHGFTGHFPDLEELSVECHEGWVPDSVVRLPGLRRLDVYGACQSQVEALALRPGMQRLRVYRSVFVETFCLRGHPNLECLCLEVEVEDPCLMLIGLPALRELRMELTGRPRQIVVVDCPRLEDLHVMGQPQGESKEDPKLQRSGELTLHDCPSLRKLDMRRLDRVDLEAIVQGCPAMEDLVMDNSGNDGIPEAIGRLSRLRIFRLYASDIERIPDSICRLTSLRVCIIHNNNPWFHDPKDSESLRELHYVPRDLLLRMSGLILELSLSDKRRRWIMAEKGPAFDLGGSEADRSAQETSS